MSWMLYRVRQFWAALHSGKLSQDDLGLIESTLTRSQLDLFNQLQTSEKMHSLRVLKALMDDRETHPDLLTAALLHDIGKIKHPLKPWHRAFAVLGRRFFPVQSQKWGNARSNWLTHSFVVAYKHPAWGADLADQAGSNDLTVTLIRSHEKDQAKVHLNPLENHLLAALQKADNYN